MVSKNEFEIQHTTHHHLHIFDVCLFSDGDLSNCHQVDIYDLKYSIITDSACLLAELPLALYVSLDLSKMIRTLPQEWGWHVRVSPKLFSDLNT